MMEGVLLGAAGLMLVGGAIALVAVAMKSKLPEGKAVAAANPDSRPAATGETSSDEGPSSPVVEPPRPLPKPKPAEKTPPPAPAESPATTKPPASSGPSGAGPPAPSPKAPPSSPPAVPPSSPPTVPPTPPAASPVSPPPASAPVPDLPPAGAPAVTAYARIPNIDEEGAAPESYQPVVLAGWNEPPQRCSLALHGLDFVNENIEPRSLAGVWKADAASRQLAVTLSDRVTAESAKFWAEAGAVKFQWLARTCSDRDRKCLKWLSACVLEMKGTQGSRYVGLYQAGRAPALAVTSAENRLEGLLDFDKPGILTAGQLHPLREFDYQLGPGKVSLDSGETFEFGKSEASPPFTVSGLAEKLEAQKVQVKLTRKASVWQFALLVTEKDAQAEKPEAAAGAKPSVLSEKQALSADLTKQLDLFERAHGDAGKKDDAVKAIAKLLGVEDAPDLPEKPDVSAVSKMERAQKLKDYRAETKKYETAVRKIREQAKDRLDALKGEIEDAEREARNAQADREQQAQGKRDRWKRAKISAHLYRMVDRTIRADDLTVGEP
jgi:cytochrome c556